jgi:hypothetical protein
MIGTRTFFGLLILLYTGGANKGRIMTTRTRKTVEEVAREQFDAFEHRERLLRMEERRERAARLNLPLVFPRRTYSPPMGANDSADAQEFV